MNQRADSWIAVGRVDDIPLRGARVVRTGVGDVAVFRTEAGTLFATEDKCPHRGGPLSEGIVHGGAVTCPLHNWVIDLSSGEAAGPDVGCVRTFPVKSVGGRVFLDLSALALSVPA